MSTVVPAKKTSGNSTARVFFCALILVAVLDIWLANNHPLARVPVATLDRSEIFQAATTYRKLPQAPDLVLFGSSLVTAPVLQSESLYLHKPIPKFLHRRCSVLEQELAHQLARNPQVFCLGAGGEMASDVYLLTKDLLSGARQPVAIIYGIAPRDFQDNRLPGPEATPAYQSLAGLADLPDQLVIPPFKPAKKIDLVLGRLSALYRYRNDLRCYLTLRLKKYMERFCPWICFDKYNSKHELVRSKQGMFPEEAQGQPTAWPGVALDHLTPADTLYDYNQRYNPLSKKSFNNQLSYLERFLALCRERGIPVLVVNMPLSTANKSLLPAGFYTHFLHRTENICRLYGADYFDLNKHPWDILTNFVDTVHLTPEQSAPVLKEIAQIASRSQIAVALRSTRQTVAQKNGRRDRDKSF